jgi:hypothetical protein
MILSETDFRLLEALARYRLLSIPQALRLGLGKDRTHLGARLRAMKGHGLVGVAEQARFLGPRVHWLREKGVELVAALAAERGEGVKLSAPKRGFVPGPHLRQRLAIVDCHISLRAWAEATGGAVEWFRVEFEANPSGMLAKALAYPWKRPNGTAAEYQPDAAGVVRLANGSRFLFAVEVETGGEAQRLDNFTVKLPGRLGAFEAFALENGAQWPESERSARLLFIFADESMLTRARGVLAKHASEAMPSVFLNSMPSVLGSFADGWVKASGEKGNPFRSQ